MLRLIFLITIFALTTIKAQNADELVKANLTTLFELSKTKAYDKAALLIAYNGEEKARVQVDSFNPANKEELNQVKRICKKISALLDLSSKHEMGKIKLEEVNGVSVNNIDVSFISGDQKLITSFSFVKTEKGYLLSDMN